MFVHVIHQRLKCKLQSYRSCLTNEVSTSVHFLTNMARKVLHKLQCLVRFSTFFTKILVFAAFQNVFCCLQIHGNIIYPFLAHVMISHIHARALSEPFLISHIYVKSEKQTLLQRNKHFILFFVCNL